MTLTLDDYLSPSPDWTRRPWPRGLAFERAGVLVTVSLESAATDPTMAAAVKADSFLHLAVSRLDNLPVFDSDLHMVSARLLAGRPLVRFEIPEVVKEMAKQAFPNIRLQTQHCAAVLDEDVA